MPTRQFCGMACKSSNCAPVFFLKQQPSITFCTSLTADHSRISIQYLAKTHVAQLLTHTRPMAPALPRHLSHFPRTDSSFGWASSNCELLNRMLTCCKRVCQSPLDSAKPAIARLVLNALYRDWILRAALCAESVSDTKELRIAARSAKPQGYVSRRGGGSQMRGAQIYAAELMRPVRHFAKLASQTKTSLLGQRTHTRALSKLTKLAHLSPCSSFTS